MRECVRECRSQCEEIISMLNAGWKGTTDGPKKREKKGPREKMQGSPDDDGRGKEEKPLALFVHFDFYFNFAFFTIDDLGFNLLDFLGWHLHHRIRLDVIVRPRSCYKREGSTDGLSD